MISCEFQLFNARMKIQHDVFKANEILHGATRVLLLSYILKARVVVRNLFPLSVSVIRRALEYHGASLDLLTTWVITPWYL